MDVKLSPALEKRLNEHVARQGGYASADAFVEQAVASLLDADEDEASVSRIRNRVQRAEGQINAGEVLEYDENTVHQLARDVHERGLKRLRGQ